MDVSKNIPEIRFKGFCDEWVVSTLGDIVDVRSGRDYKHLLKGVIPVFGTGGYMLSVNEALSYNEDAIGIGRKGTIDKPFILNSPFWTVDTLFYAVPKAQNDLYFIYDLFQKINWKQRDESTGVPSLSKVAINSIPISSTDTTEQTKIGTYFQNLDKLVTLHQEKYNKLTNIKKAMLEKMFPKNGADVPEIRFKGLEGKWVEKELISVAKYRNGKAHENDIDEKGEFTVINSKFVSTNGNVKKFSNKQNESLFKNEIAFVLSDVPNGKAIARTFLIEENNRFTLNQRIAGITPLEDSDPYFLYIILNRNPYFLQFDDGVKQTNLSKSDVEEFSSYYPVKLEQIKIGSYFQNLDKLIKLHKAKLEKLKNIKKACLEKMFV